MNTLKTILYIFGIPLFIVVVFAFFFGGFSFWLPNMVNVALASGSRDLGYIQINSDTLINANSNGTHVLTFWNDTESTTTIESVRLYLDNDGTNCDGVDLFFDAVISANEQYSNELDVDGPGYYLFEFATPCIVEPNAGSFKFIVSPADGSCYMDHYGIDVNPYATSTEIRSQNSGTILTGLEYFVFDYGDYEDLIADYLIANPQDSGDVVLTPQYVSDFEIQSQIECLTGTSCPIDFWYSENEVGADVYLAKEDATIFIIDYDYKVSDLPALSYNKGTAYPEIQSSEQVINYYWWVERDNASSSLYYFTKVFWVDEYTELNSDLNIFNQIFQRFKRIFPLGIGYQVYDIIDYVKDNEASIGPIDITLRDLFMGEVKPLVSTTSVISAGLVKEAIPNWEETVYPSIIFLVYVINFGVIIVLLYPKKS